MDNKLRIQSTPMIKRKLKQQISKEEEVADELQYDEGETHLSSVMTKMDSRTNSPRSIALLLR